MNKLLKTIKPFAKFVSFIAIQTVKVTFTLVVYILLSEDSEEPENKVESIYVLDEKGNEIIDDHVTYVFDFDDQVNYKDPY